MGMASSCNQFTMISPICEHIYMWWIVHLNIPLWLTVVASMTEETSPLGHLQHSETWLVNLIDTFYSGSHLCYTVCDCMREAFARDITWLLSDPSHCFGKSEKEPPQTKSASAGSVLERISTRSKKRLQFSRKDHKAMSLALGTIKHSNGRAPFCDPCDPSGGPEQSLSPRVPTKRSEAVCGSGSLGISEAFGQTP